jgi:hypothetical protein
METATDEVTVKYVTELIKDILIPTLAIVATIVGFWLAPKFENRISKREIKSKLVRVVSLYYHSLQSHVLLINELGRDERIATILTSRIESGNPEQYDEKKLEIILNKIDRKYHRLDPIDVKLVESEADIYSIFNDIENQYSNYKFNTFLSVIQPLLNQRNANHYLRAYTAITIDEFRTFNETLFHSELKTKLDLIEQEHQTTITGLTNQVLK